MSSPELLAHALVGKKDLPIPEWLFAWGAALVLIVTFVLLTAMWRSPKLEGERWRPLSRSAGFALAALAAALIGAVAGFLLVGVGAETGVLGEPPGDLAFALIPLASALGALGLTAVTRGDLQVADALAGLVGVILLAAIVWSGLSGTESPDRNFSITFVFVTAWLGLVVASVLFGDVFRAFNPWRAIARGFAGLFRTVAGQVHRAPLAYPERLGRWPAAAGLAGFIWLELVYGESGFGSVGLEPRIVAIAVLLYSVYTLAAMALFGIDRWLERGETFSVYFGMFASLSAVEVRDRRVGVRRALSGAREWTAGIAGSVAIVLFTIGGTAYDGASEGVLDGVASSLFDALEGAGLEPILAQRLTGTILLAATVAAVAAIFFAGIAGMRTVGGRLGQISVTELARAFVHSFIPIALAYLVAHYFTLVLYQEQAQFTYLLNDPLSDRSNLFGIGSAPIDYRLISANAVSYVQVAALVVGHAVALVIGHDRAVAMFGDSRTAARSQYWMLALMVGFTSLGLFLLSQANQ